MSEEKEHVSYYRFEDVQYSVQVDYGEDTYKAGSTKLEMMTYTVHHTTSKGVWLCHGTGIMSAPFKFVRSDTKKRFAWPTIEEALISYIARKKAQSHILSKQLSRAQDGIRLANARLCKIPGHEPLRKADECVEDLLDAFRI